MLRYVPGTLHIGQHFWTPFSQRTSSFSRQGQSSAKKFHISSIPRATYYEILEISPKSAPSAVADAYRKKAKQWHPDVNKSAEAKERFVVIKEAYDVLRDPTRRKEYDQSLESPTYGATTAYTKSGTRVVVTKRTNRTWWFFGLAACVLLWFNWNTYVRGTEEEEDIYIKNPRLYFDAKNQTKET